MFEDYTCRLYIEGEWTLDGLIDLIEARTGGERSKRSVVARDFVIDIERSRDADSQKLGDEDGFLFYRFGAFVEPAAGREPKVYVEAVSQLIHDLRRDGALVVASCDFEDEIARLTGWNWSASNPRHP